MNYLSRVLLQLVLVILTSVTAVVYGGNTVEATYLYDDNNMNKSNMLHHQEYDNKGGILNSGWPFGSGSSISVFPVPYDNSIGTNDMGNSLTIISFPKGKIDYDKYYKNAIDRLEGSGIYVSEAVPDLVGFAQVRRFVLFDLKRRIARQYRVEMSIGRSIEKVAVADAAKRHFLMEIEEQKGGTDNPWACNSYLKLVDLSGEKHEVLKELNIGPRVWTTTHDRVFLFRPKMKELQVLNMDLEPAHHPLEDVINKHKDKLKFSRMYIHPSLPFAIVHGGMGAICIAWDKNRDTAPHLLLEDAKNFSISPDGKWVTYKTSDIGQRSQTYLMPISEKYPYYLGSPILLRDDYFNDNKTAWTTKPTAFVGSDRGVLYRWDLENQDYPGKEKMSFHDYIVQEDLKKLTKEKRQGLGK